MFVQETDSKLEIRDLIDPIIYGVENTDNIILERHVEWKNLTTNFSLVVLFQ
jgi:hypothetical protein